MTSPRSMLGQLLLALGLVVVAAPGLAQVGNEMAVREALQQLLGDAVASGSDGMVRGSSSRRGVSSVASRSIIVQRGDTLDMIIQRTMGGLSIPKSILREIVVSANPHAFPRAGNPHFMLAGVHLNLPDVQELRQIFMGEASPRRDEDRRHWIRYP